MAERSKRKEEKQSLRIWMQVRMKDIAGLVLFAVMLASFVLLVDWLRDPLTLPMRTVKVEGEFMYLDREQLQAVISPLVEGGFFTVDVGSVQKAANDLPWVYRASVHRIWPDSLRIVVEEQQPAARWGEHELLNEHGEIFRPESRGGVPGLALLHGPEGREKYVIDRYLDMSDALATVGLGIAALVQDERRAWHIQLTNQVQIELGRTDPDRRLQRFVRVYPAVLSSGVAGLEYVDLRYSNGFAIRRLKDPEDDGDKRKG